MKEEKRGWMGIPGDIPFGEDGELRCFGHGAKGRYSYDYHTANQGDGGGYSHPAGLGFGNGRFQYGLLWGRIRYGIHNVRVDMIEPLPFISKPEGFVPFIKALGLKVRFQEESRLPEYIKRREDFYKYMRSNRQEDRARLSDVYKKSFGWTKAPNEEVYMLPDGSVNICCELNRNAISFAIHEAMHLLVGPEATFDEFTLLPAEWWIIKNKVSEEMYHLLRRYFSDYGFDWTWEECGRHFFTINDNDKVFESTDWLECVRISEEKGITGKNGELLLRGPHPEWKEIWQFVENQP
jgi:hypothetical protein